MGLYKDLVHSLPEEREVMEELTDVTDEFVESVKITYPQKYNNFMEKVKKIHSPNHFTKEHLEEVYAVGKIHEYYPLQDTTNYAKKEFEIDFSKESFNEFDFNFAVNEIHRTYHTIYNKDMNKCVELALSWLDFHNGKAYAYYKKLYM